MPTRCLTYTSSSLSTALSGSGSVLLAGASALSGSPAKIKYSERRTWASIRAAASICDPVPAAAIWRAAV